MNIYITELHNKLLVQQFSPGKKRQDIVLKFFVVHDQQLCTQLRLLAQLGLPTNIVTSTGDCSVNVGHFASSHHTLKQSDLLYLSWAPHYSAPLFYSPQWDYQGVVVDGRAVLTAHPLYIHDTDLVDELAQCTTWSQDIHLELTGSEHIYSKDAHFVLHAESALLRACLSNTFKLFAPTQPVAYTFMLDGTPISGGQATLRQSTNMTLILHHLAKQFRENTFSP